MSVAENSWAKLPGSLKSKFLFGSISQLDANVDAGGCWPHDYASITWRMWFQVLSSASSLLSLCILQFLPVARNWGIEQAGNWPEGRQTSFLFTEAFPFQAICVKVWAVLYPPASLYRAFLLLAWLTSTHTSDHRTTFTFSKMPVVTMWSKLIPLLWVALEHILHLPFIMFWGTLELTHTILWEPIVYSSYQFHVQWHHLDSLKSVTVE